MGSNIFIDFFYSRFRKSFPFLLLSWANVYVRLSSQSIVIYNAIDWLILIDHLFYWTSVDSQTELMWALGCPPKHSFFWNFSIWGLVENIVQNNGHLWEVRLETILCFWTVFSVLWTVRLDLVQVVNLSRLAFDEQHRGKITFLSKNGKINRSISLECMTGSHYFAKIFIFV